MDPFERALAAGYDGSVGENIAVGYASASAVMADWMASPGHRDNILNCNYRHIGIGYYYQANDQRIAEGGPFYHYWVQVFGNP
jgi:uncharacterized protein YkwD